MTVVPLNTSDIAEENPGHCRLTLSPSERQQFERQIEKLFQLGPRATAELILEIAVDIDWLLDRAEAYAKLDSDVVAALGGRNFISVPLRSVGGGR